MFFKPHETTGCYISSKKNKQKTTDLQDLILLRLVDFAGQAAVGDCIVDDWLVGLGAGLLE